MSASPSIIYIKVHFSAAVTFTNVKPWIVIVFAKLISAFVIRFLESIISKLAICQISIFYLVSVAEETVLSLALLGTPKTGFLALHVL